MTAALRAARLRECLALAGKYEVFAQRVGTSEASATAHRMLGQSQYFLGEFTNASVSLQRARARYSKAVRSDDSVRYCDRGGLRQRDHSARHSLILYYAFGLCAKGSLMATGGDLVSARRFWRDVASVESQFERARALAHDQEGLSLGFRAAISFARLLRDRRRSDEARRALQPSTIALLKDSSTDLKTANALLDSLQ